jgi:trehalose-phosphatase
MKSLLTEIDHLLAGLKGKKIYLFLDYDGTLTPIAATPDKARLSEEMRRALKNISQNQLIKPVIITGRSLPDIRNKINIPCIIYAGNHGLEMDSCGVYVNFAHDDNYEARIEQFEYELRSKLSGIKGVILENKGRALAVHFRMVAPAQAARVKKIFRTTAQPLTRENTFKFRPGKMVLELVPGVDWGKGKFANWLLNTVGERADGMAAFYFGDDLTDEEAFKTLGRRAYTVFIGSPRRSAAHYFLRDSREVIEVLDKLVNNRGSEL